MSAEQSSSSSAPSDSSKDVESKTSSKPLIESKIPTNNGSNKIKQQSSNNNKQIRKVRYSFQKRPFVIGVAGGTASGKSTVCSKIMEKLGPIDPTSVYLSHEKRVICISQDSFYRKMTDSDRTMVAKGNFNFDHPAAFDVPRLVQTLRDVLNGKMVKVPIYNYIENEISDQEETIYPADVILVEGLLLFYFPEVRDMFHMKIFVDTDPDTRLARRVMRDVKERNRDLNTCLTLYTKFVKPSFEEFCLPTKKYADIIVPRGPDNEVAVDLIVETIRNLIEQNNNNNQNGIGSNGNRRSSKVYRQLHSSASYDTDDCYGGSGSGSGSGGGRLWLGDFRMNPNRWNDGNPNRIAMVGFNHRKNSAGSHHMMANGENSFSSTPSTPVNDYQVQILHGLYDGADEGGSQDGYNSDIEDQDLNRYHDSHYLDSDDDEDVNSGEDHEMHFTTTKTTTKNVDDNETTGDNEDDSIPTGPIRLRHYSDSRNDISYNQASKKH